MILPRINLQTTKRQRCGPHNVIKNEKVQNKKMQFMTPLKHCVYNGHNGCHTMPQMLHKAAYTGRVNANTANPFVFCVRSCVTAWSMPEIQLGFSLLSGIRRVVPHHIQCRVVIMASIFFCCVVLLVSGVGIWFW